MKAAMFHGPKQPLSIEDIEVDKPQDREVKIRTVASGVCHSDLHFVDGLYPYAAPAILGHEAAGIVEEVGKPGHLRQARRSCDRVPVSVYCGGCEQCMSGHPNRCTNKAATQRDPKDKPRLSQKGKLINQFLDVSSYCERMLLHENAIVKISDDIPLDRAALVGCGVTTGVGAVLQYRQGRAGLDGRSVRTRRRGTRGDSGRDGSRVRARLSRSISSRANSRWRSGSARPTPSMRRRAIRSRRSRSLPAVAASIILSKRSGSRSRAEQAFNSVRPGGTATVIGMIPVGQKVELDGYMFLTERKLQGSNMGSNRFRIDMPQLLDFYLQGRLNLDEMISRHGKLENVNEAFRAMKAGEVARTVIDFK